MIVAALATNGVGALGNRLEEMARRIAELEARLAPPPPEPEDMARIAAEFEAMMTRLRRGAPAPPDNVEHPLEATIQRLTDAGAPEPPSVDMSDPAYLWSAAMDARFDLAIRLLARRREIEWRLHSDKGTWRAARRAQAKAAAAGGEPDPYAGRLRPWLAWQRTMRQWARAEAEGRDRGDTGGWGS